jgi:hypothetical protein
VEYVEADFADAHAALPQSRRARILFPLFALAILSSSLNRNAPVWMSLVPPALVGGFWWLTYTSGRREFIRRALVDFGPSGPRSATLRFDEFGISFESKLRTGRTAWEAMWSHHETDRAFLVFLTSSALLVVPKRAFSKADQKMIRAELASRVVATGSRRETKITSGLVLWVLLLAFCLAIWHFLRDR